MMYVAQAMSAMRSSELRASGWLIANAESEVVKKKSNPRTGSSFDSFLEEHGLFDDATEHAVNAVVAWQLAQEMKARRQSKLPG